MLQFLTTLPAHTVQCHRALFIFEIKRKRMLQNTVLAQKQILLMKNVHICSLSLDSNAAQQLPLFSSLIFSFQLCMFVHMVYTMHMKIQKKTEIILAPILKC